MDSVTREEFLINWHVHTGYYVYYLKFNRNENNSRRKTLLRRIT